jgi:hypothetical protein
MSDTTLNRFVASGTNAERIAFTPTPPTPASGPDPGYFFYETDTGDTYSWDGAAWQLVGGSGAIGGSTGATDNALIRADGTGGSTIQGGSLITCSDAGALTFPDDVRQTFNPGANAAGLNVGSLAGDPGTPSNGDLWYDSTANELTARINGANVALGAGGGAPADAEYWVETANGSLSNEVVVGTTGITTAAYASRQAAAKAGRLFLPSNGFVVERDTGAAIHTAGRWRLLVAKPGQCVRFNHERWNLSVGRGEWRGLLAFTFAECAGHAVHDYDRLHSERGREQ